MDSKNKLLQVLWSQAVEISKTAPDVLSPENEAERLALIRALREAADKIESAPKTVVSCFLAFAETKADELDFVIKAKGNAFALTAIGVSAGEIFEKATNDIRPFLFGAKRQNAPSSDAKQ